MGVAFGRRTMFSATVWCPEETAPALSVLGPSEDVPWAIRKGAAFRGGLPGWKTGGLERIVER
jgi:hypothetical protein